MRESDRRRARAVACLGLLCLLAGAGRVLAEGYRTSDLAESPPKEVGDKVRTTLQDRGIRVSDPEGEPYVDLWLPKSLATKTDPKALGVDYGFLAEGSLLGVARFHQRTKDFRGHSFAAGVCTMRFVVQPDDGDHLGVSATRDYVLLCPAKEDLRPDPMKAQDIVKLSLKVSKRKHPSILYLVKLFDKAKEKPRLIENSDLEYWILDCQVRNHEKGKAPVRLGLVLVGEAEEA